MKKLLLLLFVYLLVEGENVIGDGLYVFHRGSHAVEQLKTKVDDYYPKVKAVDKEMADALSRPYQELDNTDTVEQPARQYTGLHNNAPIENSRPNIRR